MATTNKNFKVKNGLDVGGNTVITGDANVTGKLSVTARAGDEGGEIFLSNAATNTTITNGVTIDIYKDRLRFFEQGGDARGFYVDITTGGSAASTNLVGGGGGTASNSFATVSANGTSVVADSSTDTLTITPGDGLSIVGNATSDTITFTPNVAGAAANGIVTTGTQTFAGEKTFSNTITASANIVANTGFVSADTFRLDTTYTGGSAVVGEFSWDPDFETARLLLNGATLQIGQEHLIRVKNASGSVAIPDRTLVMFAGATGDTVTVSPADSSNIATNPSDYVVGITTEEIPADDFGFVTQFGFVNQVNTAAWTVGTLLYSDPAIPGGFVSSRPAAPSWSKPVAAVTRQHATTGRIFVRALPGEIIEELDNVQITSAADNEFLAYNSANGTWINQTAEEAGVANLSGATFTGDVTATSFIGNTNASTITTGTIDNARTSANISNVPSTIVVRDTNGSFSANVVNATTFTGAATGLTSIPAANISGTITNVVYDTSTYSNPSWISSLAWSKISSTPTTVSGYGITGGVFTGDIEAVNAVFTGNVTVQGEMQVVNTTNYSVRDNMIYLNQAGAFDITNAVGNGTAVVYTVPGHDLVANDYVVVTGIDPSGYNISGSSLTTIASTGTNTITVLKTDTGTYVSGGIMRGKSHSNPDLGWAAGRTDGVGYAHTGIFRDATDATYKFFDGYIPEPDESLFIDTSHASFALAPILASNVTASRIVTTNVAAQSGNISITTNTLSITTGIFGFDPPSVNVSIGGSLLIYDDVTVSKSINANAITVAQQKNAAVVSGYNSASGAFAHASKVIMSANAASSSAPTTRPDGTSLVAGDVWISW